MREERLNRMAMLLNEQQLLRLQKARVAVFGLGGVGSACAEALARGGIGEIDLIDGDTVSVSNLNRQLVATVSEIGQLKTEAMKRRLADVAPDVITRCHSLFYLPDNAETVPLESYQYVVDAVDTVSAKLELIRRCSMLSVPLICCMGTGNRLDPSMLRTGMLFSTQEDPLARVMRHEVRKLGIKDVQVVWSSEKPVPMLRSDPSSPRSPGSVSFVPPAAGLMLAGKVIRDIAEVT